MVKLSIMLSSKAEEVLRNYQKVYGEVNNCKSLTNDDAINQILENLKEELTDEQKKTID